MARKADGPGANGSMRRLRLITAGVLIVILMVMVTADITAGQIGAVRPDYHVEPIVFGTILGGLLLVLGIEVGTRWPWAGGGGGSTIGQRYPDEEAIEEEELSGG